MIIAIVVVIIALLAGTLFFSGVVTFEKMMKNLMEQKESIQRENIW